MNVTIDENTVEILRKLLKDQNKDSVRISKCGSGCGGIEVEILMDEQRENDDLAIDKDIKIVADKSISFFFTSAVISHKEGINGIRFKVR